MSSASSSHLSLPKAALQVRTFEVQGWFSSSFSVKCLVQGCARLRNRSRSGERAVLSRGSRMVVGTGPGEPANLGIHCEAAGFDVAGGISHILPGLGSGDKTRDQHDRWRVGTFSR